MLSANGIKRQNFLVAFPLLYNFQKQCNSPSIDVIPFLFKGEGGTHTPLKKDMNKNHQKDRDKGTGLVMREGSTKNIT